jgi:hypothetical protein
LQLFCNYILIPLSLFLIPLSISLPSFVVGYVVCVFFLLISVT